MNAIGILGLFCGISVAFGLFLSSYFLLVRKERNLSSMLLGILFLAVSIRISKSIWFFIFYEVAPIGLMIGYLGLALVGPSLYFYIRNTTRKINLRNYDSIHAIIPIIGALISLLMSLEMTTIAYKSTTVIMLVYLLVSWYMHLKTNYDSQKLKSWNKHVLIAVSAVWASFAYQHLTGTLMDYAIGAGIASIPIYYLIIVVLRNPAINVKSHKVQLPQKVVDKVRRSFEEERVFLIPNLTLTQFSASIEIPAYLITKSVNQLYNKTFPETVNYFRVKEVKDQLVKNSHEFVKIEGLAYDAGFKTSSTFYTAFKKETGMTPSAFQRQHAVHTN